jgi:hypothetical protein
MAQNYDFGFGNHLSQAASCHGLGETVDAAVLGSVLWRETQGADSSCPVSPLNKLR